METHLNKIKIQHGSHNSWKTFL